MERHVTCVPVTAIDFLFYVRMNKQSENYGFRLFVSRFRDKLFDLFVTDRPRYIKGSEKLI